MGILSTSKKLFNKKIKNFRYISNALQNIYPSKMLQYISQNDASGLRLFQFFNSTRLLDVMHSSNFGTFVSNMVFGWSTQDQYNQVSVS